ncbi:hypothetical protein MWU75_03845 [Ornithinimicrobium sp. F0845]|uniref:hypothetical protein n=1 Tax=Ornithinimicrobium sp. F0845 TaxID=2926412 RepID=UPI001FF65C09|nr:hypothetical protein [Ornithinimicrobium sp. F0845]MCK0111271.1 hypothetical protein [Ornithinimicrobium sp. F0845]
MSDDEGATKLDRAGGPGAAGHHQHDPEVPPLRPLLVLTEEELLVLTDGELGAVPSRIEVPTDQGAAELVRTVATRTLMARGLITPGDSGQRSPVVPSGPGSHGPGSAGVDQDGEGIPWDATEPLGLSLSLRALAPVVVVLQRVLGPLESEQQPGRPPESTLAVRYLHLHAEVAVIEDVTPDGMHGLLTVFPDRYAEAVADFIRPKDAVAGSGGVRTLSDQAAADGLGGGSVLGLLAELGHPTVLVEVALLRAWFGGPSEQDPVQLMLALGPSGTFWSEDSRTYHPIDPDRAISELLARALAGEPGRPWTPQGSGAGAGGPT